ncbi:DNA-binding helix-turn-helix protein [Leptospira mayottensis 200901122]|uniref:DNA-binding helix-turn-helix protein n=2 Tax=Leptospira mayottensis TaxID=1137606 RepID=A0AA87MQS1_9LEPT|nr:helix-turn-helix transcriptional regulator [Leptospira mayottensis]AXR64680.1 XRE family transcriptional regulator [Leptospira mayottensis]EKS01677.1 DNA-binding helix-turn-helix protein [Leptospira mayottensis 200901122]
MKLNSSEKIDKEVVKRFNIALKFLLETQGLSQRKLALLIKDDQSTISRIASGKLALSIKFAVNLEHYTDISSNWILSGEGEMLIDSKRSEVFTDEEIIFFAKIKSDETIFELVRLLAKMKKENLEVIKRLVTKLKN